VPDRIVEPGGWWTLRILAGGAAVLCTALVAWNVPQFIGSPGEYRLYLLIIVPATIAAALGAWFAFRGDRPETRAVLAPGCIGGMILGGAGLVAGFVGPILLAPDANQGPLLGIIVTGPLGFAVGTVAGLTIGMARHRLRRPKETD
jgi:hypothetical protein